MNFLGQGGLAITIASGAAKGAWGLGWFTELAELHPEFMPRVRVVYGTSVGALIAAAMTRAVLLDETWPLNQAWEAMLELGKHGLSQELLADLIQQCLPDNAAQAIVKQEWVELGACAMSTVTLKGRLFSTAENLTADELRRALLASAAVPSIMPPVWVVSEDETFVDGAVTDFNPVGFLGFSPKLKQLGTVWRLDYEPGRIECRPQTAVFVEPPSLATRAAGAAFVHLSKRVLGVGLPAGFASAAAGLLGALVTKPGSESRRILDTYSRQDSRHLLELPCWSFRPERALPLNALDFDVPLLCQAYDMGRAAAHAFAKPQRTARGRATPRRA